LSGEGDRHVGLIGGIGPAATDFYYRRLIATFAARVATLELTMAHADTPTLLGHMARGQADAQTAIYLRLTERLAAAGAASVAVTSIAGHFCIEAFKQVSPLPVIDLLEAVSREVEGRGLKRLGVLGTRTVMESRLYGSLSSAELVTPRGPDLERVHAAYIAMATAGYATEEQKSIMRDASRWLLEEERAEAILLGGTDLALVFDGSQDGIPVVDCAAIHADAIARWALGAAG
jgi:aspartate racemase